MKNDLATIAAGLALAPISTPTQQPFPVATAGEIARFFEPALDDEGAFTESALNDLAALDSALDVVMERHADGRYSFGLAMGNEAADAVRVPLDEALGMVRAALLDAGAVTIAHDNFTDAELATMEQGAVKDDDEVDALIDRTLRYLDSRGAQGAAFADDLRRRLRRQGGAQ